MADGSDAVERGLEITAALGETREALDKIDPEFAGLSLQTSRAQIWSREGMGLRDRCLITVAVLIALKCEPMAMKPNIRRAIRQGISDREFREMLYQTMHYAGWAVGGPAMRNYQEVLAEAEFKDAELPADAPAEVLLNDTENAYQLGLDVMAEFDEAPRDGLDGIDQEFSDMSVARVFGGPWAREGLGLRDRCLVTVAVLIALGREPMAMKPNLRRAIKIGVSDREFRELLYQTLHYAGWSVGGPAMRNYKEVLAEAA